MSCDCHVTLQLVCTLVQEQDSSLAEQIMNNLLGRQVDANYVVRMYCIRGLGNMASINETQVIETTGSCFLYLVTKPFLS